MQSPSVAPAEAQTPPRPLVRRLAPWLFGSGLAAGVVLLPDLALAALSRAAAPERTLAYLDPGTGSFVIQAVVAGLAGAAVTLRLYWGKIKGLFGSSASDPESATDDE